MTHHTHRLDFDDPYLRAFDARVVARSSRQGGPAIALDRSAFYPEGGGQPGDRGKLGGIAVLDTQEEDGLVWHLLADELPGNLVSGEIDWARRFDFMQQHHGQHLLSAAFEQLFQVATVSVHLGEEACTVDLDRVDLTPEQLAQAEELTNSVVWADHPVSARFVDGPALQAIPLRKPPGQFERIRIVSAGDFDHSACGGTHPSRTGEVGVVALRRWERRGNELRVEFICGARFLRDYRTKNELLYGLARDLSVGVLEVPSAVERLREAGERNRKGLLVAEEQLLRYEAAELLALAERAGGVAVVTEQWEGRELDSIRSLARHIADRGGVALLGLAGAKAQLVFARAAGLTLDMGAVVREASTVIGGRGGGRPEAAQGGGPEGSRVGEALNHAAELVRAQLD